VSSGALNSTPTNQFKHTSQQPLLSQGARGSASPVLTATGFVNGRGLFSTPQNPHPLTDHQKIVTGDYVGGLYTAVPNLVQMRQRGASMRMGEI